MKRPIAWTRGKENTTNKLAVSEIAGSVPGSSKKGIDDAIHWLLRTYEKVALCGVSKKKGNEEFTEGKYLNYETPPGRERPKV